MKMDWPGRLSLLAAACAVAFLLFALTFSLESFPGLHGDEAWAGLRAIDILANGATSVHGMNTYSGGLFPQIVAAFFSHAAANVTWLRMPGVIFNVMAVAILAFAFRAYRHAALTITLLFASSLLFLFYSRIAWEVSALQNFLVAIIIVCAARLLRAPVLPAGTAALFFAAFALGTLNHFIFSAAAISFAVTAGLIASRTPSAATWRLFFMAALNLLIQLIVMVTKHFMLDGPFVTHVLPAFSAGALLVWAGTAALVRFKPEVLRAAQNFLASRPRFVSRFHRTLLLALSGCFILILPFNGASFWGTVSGAVAMERVTSHVPGLLESIFLYLRMAILCLAFGWLAHRRLQSERPHDHLKELLLVWPIAFLVIMQMETIGLSDRYFIIPQAIFFAALALCLNDLPVLGRRAVQAVMIVGVIQAQLFFWGAVMRKDAPQPLQRFRYAFYFDTSRHFLKMDGLAGFLKQSGTCAVTSTSYFIAQPMKFLLAAPNCPASNTVRVEYCDTCRKPVPWFRIWPSQNAVKPGE